MKQLWATVVDRAREFGVQVFATTHSWDCIQGLAELCEENEMVRSEVAVHKLDRNLNRSVSFDGVRSAGCALFGCKSLGCVGI